MTTPAELIEVRVSAPNLDVAKSLGRGLVAARLAACAQIVPGLTSIFAWEGRIDVESEVLLLLKTTGDRWPQLRDFVAAEHPYDTPEVVAVPITHADPRYAAWLGDALSAGPAEPA